MRKRRMKKAPGKKLTRHHRDTGKNLLGGAGGVRKFPKYSKKPVRNHNVHLSKRSKRLEDMDIPV